MPTNNYSDNSFDDQASLDDEQLWDLLSLYVDGEADPDQAAIVERMLSSDPAYRRDFDFLMASSKTMHMMDEVEPPASLREIVLSKTSRRPTLVGRLRAAWNRATVPTSPAFGRYATVGGAFAAAALGAVIFWPRAGSHSNTNSTPQVAITHTQTTPSTHVADTHEPRTIVVPQFPVSPIKPGKSNEPKTQVHNRGIAPTSPRMNAVANPPKATNVPDKQIARTVKPHNYMLPKNDTPDNGKSELVSYPYDKKMDVAAARQTMGTIVEASNSDFGPKVTANDDVPTTPQPQTDPNTHTVDTATMAANDANLTPSSAPKPHVRVSVLPPMAKQVLAETTLRKIPPPRLDNYDRVPVADSGQHRELLTLLKSPL